MTNWNTTQVPDTKPGPYYVTAQDKAHYWLMRGPYERHVDALAAVSETLAKACELDARATWKAWGTSRLDPALAARPGKMNGYFT